MISENTTVTIGLLISLLGTAFFAGIMWQKVDGLKKQFERIERKLDDFFKSFWESSTEKKSL